MLNVGSAPSLTGARWTAKIVGRFSNVLPPSAEYSARMSCSESTVNRAAPVVTVAFADATGSYAWSSKFNGDAMAPDAAQASTAMLAAMN